MSQGVHYIKNYSDSCRMQWLFCALTSYPTVLREHRFVNTEYLLSIE